MAIYSCGKCKQKIDVETVPTSGICVPCSAAPDMSKFVSLDDHKKIVGERDTFKASVDDLTGKNRNLSSELEAVKNGGRGNGGQGGSEGGTQGEKKEESGGLGGFFDGLFED